MKRYILFVFVSVFLISCSAGYKSLTTMSSTNEPILFDKVVDVNSKSISQKQPQVLTIDKYPDNVFLSLYRSMGENYGFTLAKDGSSYKLIFGMQPIVVHAKDINVDERAFVGSEDGFKVALASVDRKPFVFFSLKPVKYNNNSIVSAKIKYALLYDTSNKEKVKKFLQFAQKELSYSNIQSLLNRLNNSYGMHISLTSIADSQRMKTFEKEQPGNELKGSAKQYFDNALDTDCDTWKGIVDDSGFPKGKGEVLCREEVARHLFFPVYLDTSVNTTINNHTFNSGTITISVDGHNYYKDKAFYSTDEAKRLINEVREQFTNNFKAKIASKNQTSSMDCNSALSKCKSHCNSKSDRGGMLSNSAKTTCNLFCESGYRKCQAGNYYKAKFDMCSGMCQGLKQTSDALIFGTSDYDTCVTNCTVDFK